MSDKPAQTAASRLKSRLEASATSNYENSASKTSTSYLDKLPRDMITNLYKATKQQQPPANIHDIIFSRLREIDRQYHEETSAKLVDNLREFVNRSVRTSPLSNIKPGVGQQYDQTAKKADNKARRPISAGAQRAHLTAAGFSRETGTKRQSAHDKLSQLFDDDYIIPKTPISSAEVSNYLAGRAGLVQQDVSKYISEYTKKRQNDAFNTKLARIEALAAAPESKQVHPMNLGSLKYDGIEAQAGNVLIDTGGTICTTLSLADFHNQILHSGYSKSSTYRSSAGETLDEPVEKIRTLIHGNSLGLAEKEKRQLESKRRILFQALKRANSYTEKEAIMNELQHMKS